MSTQQFLQKLTYHEHWFNENSMGCIDTIAIRTICGNDDYNGKLKRDQYLLTSSINLFHTD